MADGPGMIAGLPRPAWVAVMWWLTQPPWTKDAARRASVLALRQAHPALAALVARHGCGGGGRILGADEKVRAAFEAADTAALGRTLVVEAPLANLPVGGSQLAVVAAAVEAVRRGHMVEFRSMFPSAFSPEVARAAEAMLVEASEQKLLVRADIHHATGWSVDVLAQLPSVVLQSPGEDTVAGIVGARAVTDLGLRGFESADLTALASLRYVELLRCDNVEDLAALSSVPHLFVGWCMGIRALPAMRNDVLELWGCAQLNDVSGLAGGRLGRLKLWRLDHLGDISAIGAMRPPPRTMILRELPEVQDLSMLAGIYRLEVIKCRKLDKVATLAALEGRVGTVHWT